MNIDLDALQALAEKATQGEGQHIYTDPRDDNNWRANHAWHLACSPSFILSLIARIRELEGDTGKSADTERLDWLDDVNRKANERNSTKYGWKFDINHNRAALTDHNWPAVSIREAIDDARGRAAPEGGNLSTAQTAQEE